MKLFTAGGLIFPCQIGGVGCMTALHYFRRMVRDEWCESVLLLVSTGLGSRNAIHQDSSRLGKDDAGYGTFVEAERRFGVKHEKTSTRVDQARLTELARWHQLFTAIFGSSIFSSIVRRSSTIVLLFSEYEPWHSSSWGEVEVETKLD